MMNGMYYRHTLHLLFKGYGRYKPQIAVLIILGLLGAFTESLGVTAIIPIFSRLTGEWSSSDLGSKTIAKILGWFGLGFDFKILLAVIIAAFIVKSVIVLVSQYAANKIVSGYENDAKNNLIKGIFNSRWPFLMRQQAGYIETVLVKDIGISRKIFAEIAGATISIASLFVYIIIAFSISSVTTLLSLLVGGLIFFFLKPILYKTRSMASQMARLNSDTAQYVFETIAGVKSIKTSSKEEPVSLVAKGYFKSFRDAHIKLHFLQALAPALTEPVSVIFVIGVFAFLYTAGEFELGVFAAIMFLIHRIFQYIMRLQGILYQVNSHVPHLERVVDLQEQVEKNREYDAGKKKFSFNEALEFRDVSFAYSEGKEILTKLNVYIKKGIMVGIVGKSGAGKTTIVDLLLRLLIPQAGKIFVDGVDISEISITEWRKNIGYVSQEIFVMNDTIANNIKFYDDTITQEDIERSSKMAYIYDFIQGKREKFETKAGERGVFLSGGEKQRIVLARVLARNPSVLILDEATSALDNESELLIQKAIDGLRGEATILVIAHRLSTLLSCDKIIFLENGEIKEEGSPKDLLERRGSSFYRLYNIRKK